MDLINACQGIEDPRVERHINDKITTERRYVISSLENDAKRFGHTIRKH